MQGQRLRRTSWKPTGALEDELQELFPGIRWQLRNGYARPHTQGELGLFPTFRCLETFSTPPVRPSPDTSIPSQGHSVAISFSEPWSIFFLDIPAHLLSSQLRGKQAPVTACGVLNSLHRFGRHARQQRCVKQLSVARACLAPRAARSCVWGRLFRLR